MINQQQKNSHIEERLPDELKCPICGSPAKQVMTKRGIHYKCSNDKCKYDTNRPFDFSKEKRRATIKQCAFALKKLIPECNYVENYGFSPDMVFTGNKKKAKLNYDLSVYFMGMKLQRLRVEINQSLTKKKFLKSEFCYVIGRPEIVDYLAERKGLVVHFLVDEPVNKIGVSRMDHVKNLCPMREDHFGNQQYFIEKEYRDILVKFDRDEIEDLFFSGFHRKLYRNLILK